MPHLLPHTKHALSVQCKCYRLFSMKLSCYLYNKSTVDDNDDDQPMSRPKMRGEGRKTRRERRATWRGTFVCTPPPAHHNEHAGPLVPGLDRPEPHQLVAQPARAPRQAAHLVQPVNLWTGDQALTTRIPSSMLKLKEQSAAGQ